MTVPDYVFEDDYKLMPLEKLAKFVDREKHLPKIASASDVKENGINVSQTQLNLLEKIEELTLYTIAQHRQIKKIEKENADMKAKYEERLAGLEKLVPNLASSDLNLSSEIGKIALK